MILAHLDINDSILLKANDKSFHAFYHILLQVDSTDLVWYADRVNKTAIISKMAITLPTLEKMIASLRERELLLPMQRGKYLINSSIIESY